MYIIIGVPFVNNIRKQICVCELPKSERVIWESVKRLLQTHGNLNIDIIDKSLIFDCQKDKLIYYLIINAKHYIHKTKFTSKRLSILGFQLSLKKKV